MILVVDMDYEVISTQRDPLDCLSLYSWLKYWIVDCLIILTSTSLFLLKVQLALISVFWSFALCDILLLMQGIWLQMTVIGWVGRACESVYILLRDEKYYVLKFFCLYLSICQCRVCYLNRGEYRCVALPNYLKQYLYIYRLYNFFYIFMFYLSIHLFCILLWSYCF